MSWFPVAAAALPGLALGVPWHALPVVAGGVPAGGAIRIPWRERRAGRRHGDPGRVRVEAIRNKLRGRKPFPGPGGFPGFAVGLALVVLLV